MSEFSEDAEGHHDSTPTDLASAPDKLYLENPKRIEAIRGNRELQNKLNNMTSPFGANPPTITPQTSPEIPSKAPSSLSDLKPIFIQEIDPTIDKVYEGRILNTKIIEDPGFGLLWLQLLAQDETGDVIDLIIMNIPLTNANREKYGYGSRISIINPHMKLSPDGDKAVGIWVDELWTFLHLGKINDMCRYCGEEDAPRKCGRCKRARYCGRNCQKKDWKTLNHMQVCLPAVLD